MTPPRFDPAAAETHLLEPQEYTRGGVNLAEFVDSVIDRLRAGFIFCQTSLK
jgi:hypothetical protein